VVLAWIALRSRSNVFGTPLDDAFNAMTASITEETTTSCITSVADFTIFTCSAATTPRAKMAYSLRRRVGSSEARTARNLKSLPPLIGSSPALQEA
jgi:hypothetical protein